MSAPRVVSNNVDDFVGGGLYTGGTGVITDIFYTTAWTYEGKVAAGANMTVMCKFQPLDGSNEGKLMEVPWSCGTAGNEFAPSADGGSVLAIGSKDGMSESTNWAAVQKAFKDQCGLDTKMLNGPTGIKVLVGTQVQLLRKDQAKREGLDEANAAAAANPQSGQQQGNKKKAFAPSFLCPIKATFPWEKGGATVAQMPAPTPGVAAPTVAVPVAGAPVAAMPTVSSDSSVGAMVRMALESSPTKSIPFAELSQKVSELFPKFPGILRSQRAGILAITKDIDKLDPEVSPLGIVISDDGSTVSL